MTDAIVSSVVAAVATTGKNEKQVSSLIVSAGVEGEPSAIVSLAMASVVTVHPSPLIDMSQVSICVLRNPYVKHTFTAVWID